MASSIVQDQIEFDFPPFARIYKGGRVERLLGTTTVPPSDEDPETGVASKDVVISPENNVSARLYLPKLVDPSRKLPILVYYHGGGFCVETSFSPTYHLFLNRLVAQANVVAVSVDYRRIPEHPLPAAYDDSWVALQWVVSHATGGSEPWLREHGDFTRLVVGGDSAGANISQNMAMRATGKDEIISGALLIHPYFWGTEAIGKEPTDPKDRSKIDALWTFAWPSSSGQDDTHVNPVAAGPTSLKELGCKQVLVCVAEKDILRDRGWLYYNTLAKSGWDGVVEMFESDGEDHVFHLFNPICENAAVMMKRLADFFLP
ncbi:Alpha/beta hydrolase fold-3 [Cinnamomum micranthum f. kanehirae]|uniref:Alpha/beta hydrolase fold-3 n=1 Tax=Cinnamomum micranthum f. kanehirae TaxID=337451 RepID=A0A3S3M982_9MAGN|nr:Alpha/beta hydrolase fold-3 [Cinnamomum micranthum f. kanehirae]